MNGIALRLRQLTLAAFLVAVSLPVVASSAAADTPTCFNAQFLVGLPGGTSIGSIVTHECVTSGTFPGTTFTTAGTFNVMVGSTVIATGELTAAHTSCSVTAAFEGELRTGQDFSGSLNFNSCSTPPSGITRVILEDVATITVTFICSTPVGGVCTPTSFAVSSGHD
jgi:hypothetical protein